ncbi:hypothetical protein MVES1_003422 [Malassezia vespertilionis]|nr:uncharacterized protein MVES1_003422 [Malassezia vespertilionis]WFD08053.1 hypothetical protein MVES1_003422 [Malassezia vespertilionis]
MGMSETTGRIIRPLAGNEMDEILKERLAADEKLLRRVVKRISTLAHTQSDEERTATEILLQSDVQLFLRHLDRLHRTAEITAEREIQAYHTETEQLRAACTEESAAIAQCEVKLQEALAKRQHRLEYDALARKIVVYPQREQLESTLESLHARIAALKEENAAHEQVEADAKAQLATIGSELQVLHDGIQSSLRHVQTTSLNPNASAFEPGDAQGTMQAKEETFL